jgi:hypothetical protein
MDHRLKSKRFFIKTFGIEMLLIYGEELKYL